MRRIITMLFVTLAVSTTINASHVRGGEIFWRCITADNRTDINNEYNSNFTVLDHGKFVFIAKLYGDCGGAVGIFNNFTPQFQIGGYSGGGPTSSPTILVEANDISPDCFSSALRWTCGTPNAQGGYNNFGATGPLNGIGATAEYIYRSNAFQLNGSPPVNGAWIISIGPHCCRNPAVNVVGSPLFYLKSEMYPYPDVPNPRTHGANPPFTPMFPCYDNSPEFLELPNVVSCNGYPFTYGPLAFDRELDSLVYDWGTPLLSATGSIPFAGGYSFTNPLPSNAPNVAASLDPVSGLITFESYVNGAFTTNTEVLAYRCAIPIAAVYRDVQIVTANCDAAYTSQNPPMLVPVNDPPSVTFVPDSTLNFTNPSTNTYRFTVEAGTLVEFVLNAQDFDLLPNSNFQTITFEAASGQLGGPNWDDTTDCGNPPCATIFPATGQTGFVSSLNNTVEFSWQTDCNHLAANIGCGVFSNEYVFYLKMEDNYCPTPARTLITVVVDVQAGTANPPELVCATPAGPNQSELTMVATQDTGFKFNYYIVEIDTNGSGNFVPIDTIYDYDPGTFTVPDSSGPASFFRIRTNSGCNFVSPGSNIVGTFTLDLTQRPVGSPDKDTADLSWSDPRPNDTATIEYFVEYEFPAGSDNWVLAGSATARDWIEPMLLCSLEVSFRVGYEAISSDSSVTCTSYSTLQSGVFQNTSNDDTTIVNYVTVNQTTGNAEISFEQSPLGDVVEYQIHWWNDTLGDWVIIDTAGALGNYSWPASQASSRVERFRVVSVDSCGNVSDSTIVRPHNTILLNSDVDICAGTNTLSWNTYNGWGNEIMSYELRADIDDQQGGVSPNVLLFAGGREDTVFVQDEFVSGAIYCYRVIAIRDDSVTMSESFPICMNPGVPNPSEMLYISEVDVRGDGILLRGFADGEADATHITIERSREPNGTYFELARIDMPTTPPYTFTYVDYVANPSQNVYYYRLIAADSCGGVDTTSNTVNNIQLSVEHKRNEQNWVSWNSFNGFAGDLIGYEIYRAVRETGPFELLDDALLPIDTVFVDNLRNLDPDVNTLCYYVRAVEVNNPLELPDMFVPGFARSNRACVTQQAKLVMPNAFRPGSSIEKNQTFGPDTRYVDLRKFEMIIMDRWGKVVFESKDPQNRWNGEINGRMSPTGVYTYLIRYQTKGDLPQELSGSFTLIQ